MTMRRRLVLVLVAALAVTALVVWCRPGTWMVHVYPFEQDPAKAWAH